MKPKMPNTTENLERHFITKASVNSTIALQMAQQLWSDHGKCDGQIADYVDLLNTISIKLKNHCWYLNWKAYDDFKKAKDEK